MGTKPGSKSPKVIAYIPHLPDALKHIFFPNVCLRSLAISSQLAVPE